MLLLSYLKFKACYAALLKLHRQFRGNFNRWWVQFLLSFSAVFSYTLSHPIIPATKSKPRFSGCFTFSRALPLAFSLVPDKICTVSITFSFREDGTKAERILDTYLGTHSECVAHSDEDARIWGFLFCRTLGLDNKDADKYAQ